MKQNLENAQSGEPRDKATDIMLIENPLEFIAEDHSRVKKVAEMMHALSAQEGPELHDLHDITSFLENELPLLLHDEDDDLLALLRPRVAPGDGFDQLTTQLARVHRAIEGDRQNILQRLKSRKADQGDLTQDDRTLIEAAAKRLIEDMIMENAKLLPLARKRLTPDDIATLRSRMVQRRISDMRGARDNAR